MSNRHSWGSPGCTILSMVAVAFAVLMVLLILLGVTTLFFKGSQLRRAEAEARNEAVRAAVEADRAELLQQRAGGEEARRFATRQMSPLPLIVTIDQDGNMAVDDERVDLDALRSRMRAIGGSDPSRLVVELKVDPDLRAKHLATVQALCRELGVRDVRISLRARGSSPTQAEISKPDSAEIEY